MLEDLGVHEVPGPASGEHVGDALQGASLELGAGLLRVPGGMGREHDVIERGDGVRRRQRLPWGGQSRGSTRYDEAWAGAEKTEKRASAAAPPELALLLGGGEDVLL